MSEASPPTPAELELQLEKVFGFSSFRPGQPEIIHDVVSGRPTLAVMPTGAGKSLCYQLPAVTLPGVTIVVSPLIALIRDQVRGLVDKGIAAACITSLDPPDARREVMQRLKNGDLDLCYVAPERFRSGAFRSVLAQLPIALFAVDEAHCISQWGFDFRPDYARLGEVIRELKPARVAAFTATATPDVRADIVQNLGFVDPSIIVTGFDRENLELSVEETSRGQAKLEAASRALSRWMGDGGSAIVYVATRKKSEEVARALRERGFEAGAYHAGLEPGARRDVQTRFEDGAIRVVVATTAFGMGVDKSDVRVVVHFQVPSAPEAYYQEVGRAGRDGAPAGGVLIYDSGDLRYAYMRHEASCPTWETVSRTLDRIRTWSSDGDLRMSFDELVERLEPEVGIGARAALISLERAGDVDFDGRSVFATRPEPTVEREALEKRARQERARLDAMIGYVMRAACRRRYLVDYFGDARRPERCEVCDRCALPASRALEGEALRHAQIALSCVARMRGRYGKTRVVDVLVGSRAKPVVESGLDRLSTHGLLVGWTKDEVLQLLDALIRADLAKITLGDYPKLLLSEQGAEDLRARKALCLDLELPRWRGETAPPPKAAKKRSAPVVLPASAGRLFEALRVWRSQVAKDLGRPPYVVAHDALLARISEARPTTLDTLALLPGIGPAKLAQYGDEILSIVRAGA